MEITEKAPIFYEGVQMTFHLIQDVVQSLNFASILSIKECITEHIRFYHVLSDDGFEESDVSSPLKPKHPK